jgi:hypothetical protein
MILRVIHPSSQFRFALVIARWLRPHEEADKDHDDGTQGEATEAAQQAGHVRYDHGRSSNFVVLRGLFRRPNSFSSPHVGQRCCGCNLTFVQNFHVDVSTWMAPELGLARVPHY